MQLAAGPELEALLAGVQSPNEVVKLELQVDDIDELRVEAGKDHVGEVLEHADPEKTLSVLHL